MRKIDTEEDGIDLEELLKTNLFIFKENLKLVFSGVVDQLWNKDIASLNVDSALTKRKSHKKYSDIIEIVEENEDVSCSDKNSLEQEYDDIKTGFFKERFVGFDELPDRASRSKSLDLDCTTQVEYEDKETGIDSNNKLISSAIHNTHSKPVNLSKPLKKVLFNRNKEQLSQSVCKGVGKLVKKQRKRSAKDTGKEVSRKRHSCFNRNTNPLAINSHNNISINININKNSKGKIQRKTSSIYRNSIKRKNSLMSRTKAKHHNDFIHRLRKERVMVQSLLDSKRSVKK